MQSSIQALKILKENLKCMIFSSYVQAANHNSLERYNKNILKFGYFMENLESTYKEVMTFCYLIRF